MKTNRSLKKFQTMIFMKLMATNFLVYFDIYYYKAKMEQNTFLDLSQVLSANKL